MKKTAVITILVGVGALFVLASTVSNNPSTAKGNPPGASRPNPPATPGMAPAPARPAPKATKPATGMGATPTPRATPTPPAVPAPVTPKDATKTPDPKMPDPTDPIEEDLCADGPFSYEYIAGDKVLAKPDNKIFADVYGPNYSCFLVALLHKTMPGTVPGVISVLKKKSANSLQRFWAKFEVRVRKYAWNTLDAYIGEKDRLFDTDHAKFMKANQVTRLLLEKARYHDVLAGDRFHPGHHYSYGSSSSKRRSKSRRSKRHKKSKCTKTGKPCPKF